MARGLWSWSKTAASNATADSTINFAEGQAPSSLNDSNRAVMARIAEYRDDISGALATGGTSTAYTVTTNQILLTPTPTTGQMIAFTPHVTNAAGPVTLTCDGGSAYQIQSLYGTSLVAGVLIASTPYQACFNGTAWVLVGFYGNPYNIPLSGGMDYWGSTSAPNSSFAKPYGQAISRTTYATLFSLMGTTYGTGDGSTTFNLPDKAGRVSAALDNLSGSRVNRITTAFFGADATNLGAVGGAESEGLSIANINSFTPTGTFAASLASGNVAIPQQGNAGTGSPITSEFSEGANNKAATALNVAVTGSVSGPVAMAALGSGNAHINVQPTIVCNYIMRVI